MSPKFTCQVSRIPSGMMLGPWDKIRVTWEVMKAGPTHPEQTASNIP